LGFDAAKLVLLDIDGLGMGEMIDRLQMLAARASTCPIAIMNADERGRLDYIAAWPAIKGIFFRQTLQENLIKGIHAMFGGECWLPRRILSARWGQARPARFSALSELARLTPKEIETLKLLAGGSSNDAIARELKVSLHTVKTHVYNVFRKLNITNRVQAAHWALQHIEGVARD